MSHRVVDSYLEIFHEETNSYVRGTYVLPVSGGHETVLDAATAATLNAILNRLDNSPNAYPIPADQLAQLVAAQSFPDSFEVSNFPTEFACNNFPETYALPFAQEAMLSGLQTTVNNLSKGSAAADENTLRVTIATNQSRMTPISYSAPGDLTVVTPSTGKGLRISAIALSAPTGNSLTIKQGTLGEGQSNLSGAIAFQSLALDFAAPIALAAGRSLVLNLGSAATVTGYAVTWEE